MVPVKKLWWMMYWVLNIFPAGNKTVKRCFAIPKFNIWTLIIVQTRARARGDRSGDVRSETKSISVAQSSSVVTISSSDPKYGVTLDLLAYLIRSGRVLDRTGVVLCFRDCYKLYKPAGLILARDAHLQILKSLHCSKLLLSSNKPHRVRRLIVTSET